MDVTLNVLDIQIVRNRDDWHIECEISEHSVRSTDRTRQLIILRSVWDNESDRTSLERKGMHINVKQVTTIKLT